MANLSKFSAQESLNLETTMNWNANSFNPRFILELSATPKSNSNVLYNVGGTARSITYNLS